MEKDRTIIVIIISMLAILVYFQFFGPKPKPQPAPPPGHQAPQPQPGTPPQPQEPREPRETPAVQAPREQPQLPEEPPVPEKSGAIRTAALEFEWKNQSAAFAGITLTAKKDGSYAYPDHTRENPLRLLFSEDGEDLTLRLCRPDSMEDIASGNWEVVKEEPSILSMKARTREGVTITKQFSFTEDSYHLLFELRLRNDTTAGIISSYRVLVTSGILEETGRRTPGGSVVAQRVGESLQVKRSAPSKLTDEKPVIEYTAGGVWAGLENMYFAAVLAPEDKLTTAAVGSIIVERAFEAPEGTPVSDPDRPQLLNMRVIMASKDVSLEPGEEQVHRYVFFVGPKQDDILSQYQSLGFDRLIDYGKFGFLSKLFLWILRGIYYVIPNWGVAVIILTLIVRACLHPVSRKSQMSMQRYQQSMLKLKPKLDQLKEKHKNKREKLTKETMKLYKEEGVSMFPAGGCLLMLLQIPVFIGLYWALSLSIELRQASFVFWINDLSQPDAAFSLAGNIPLLGTPNINILPIFMLAAMVFQQLTQPRAADPQQAQQQKMTMYIMMFVIGFIFYNMPSGLVLYFLTSTLVGIGETRLIKRKLAAEG